MSTRSRVVSESAADSSPSYGYGVLRSTGSRLAALDPSAAPSAGAKRPLVSSSTASAGGSSSQQQSDRPANLALRRLAAEAADEHVRSPGDSRRVRTFSSGMYGYVYSFILVHSLLRPLWAKSALRITAVLYEYSQQRMIILYCIHRRVFMNTVFTM